MRGGPSTGAVEPNANPIAERILAILKMNV